MTDSLDKKTGRSGATGEVLIALGFVVLAVLLRLPGLLYSVTNFDESLYLLIGEQLAEGVLPFTGLCDRKPFGLFALFAIFAAMPFDAIVASRLGASLSVELTAYMLHRVAGLLFDERKSGRVIGPTAGLAYILFSLANGGAASNSEVFLNAFAVLGLLLALLAVRGRGPMEPPRLGLMIASGLVLGLGIQVKQTILFDMLAFLAGFFLLTTPRSADLGDRLRISLRGLIALGVTALIPSLAVLLLYVVTGHWEEWALANIGAQRGFVDDPNQGIAFDPAFRAMAEQAPLWVGTIAAGISARWLVRDRADVRAVVFLFVWAGLILLLQLFLRIAADHYFLQFLPPFCLLNGLLLGRTVLVAMASRPARVGLLAVVAALALFGISKNQLVHTAYVARDRYIDGQAWAGDTPRQIASDIKPLLKPGDAVYQIGFLPIVYHLTGGEIPTRFAFTGLPHRSYAGRDGCPWVPQIEEARRVLDTRPRFIVVEDGVFFRELDPPVKALIEDRLASDYRLVRHYEMHWIHELYPFERFVLNAAAPAWVYELKEPAPQEGAPLASASPDIERGDHIVPDHADGDPRQR
jgi:4-amino-4-deoxy-L-arabinose transferase-like glycosyltransferase